jgi:ABC-2 type transport system ATP-binding protein
MDEAENCDRIAIIDNGRIIALDTSSGLKRAVGGDVITLTSAYGQVAAAELRERYGISAVLADRALSFQVPAGEAFLPDFVRSFGQPIETSACEGLISTMSSSI